MHTLSRLLEAQDQVRELQKDGLMNDYSFGEISEYIEGLIEDVYEEEKEAHKLGVSLSNA
ncbi:MULTISPECIES: hypothetical protein [Bacillales]|uniref:hypothetical protein n=1 Tax=Bacillales TaxID=1385 RepID=UPI00190E012A|nr:hypothetical protein [Staphylococcus aureus]MBK3311794.1 hypothetical protein [Staphylococcus aureus]WAI28713.1 MAG: hypothetical protein NRZ50_10365 [Bacillus paranthracis]WAI33478.1 MAG: hypothetical protein NRZ52_04695 [Bacillus paranthracis]WAI38386.1 MAG: hypothetical protein NRZ51_27935 [Bacillus paranthracis]